MTDLAVQLRVTSVRHPGKFGGAIFFGRANDGQSYVVVCDNHIIPDPSIVEKGQQWSVKGIPSKHELLVNGFVRKETQIAASQAELVRPAGRNIISWIAACEDCPGVGQVKATKLWDEFGVSLPYLIEQRDIASLSKIITKEYAELLCLAFAKHRVADTLLWLDQVGIQRRIGAKVVDFYKHEAQAKIEANPYCLLSFEANWTNVDDLASKRFGIQADDPRRLEAAIEEALYRGLKKGHTCLPEDAVKLRMVKLIGSAALVKKALSLNADRQQYIKINGLFQPTGMHLIEQYVADRLKQMVLGENEVGQAGLFTQPAKNPESADSIVDKFERANGFELSLEQRHAVILSAGSHLSLILGGAGTGKTTVLKALYDVLEELQPGISIYQLAPTGRAAQRMEELSGRESRTIAGFLVKVESADIDLGSVIVVDESSMIDVILMYRLLRHLPSGVRLILVGDPSQLPPIGPGLVLHALAGLPLIPQTELKVVKRQSSASGIPQVAAAIRNHQVPTWAQYQAKADVGVSFVPCHWMQLDAAVEQIYGELGGNGSDYSVEILCPTNKGRGGVNDLNAALHSRYRQSSQPVSCYSAEFGVVGATTLARVSLNVGDLVMYTENDYELGLRNGSLGTIIEALVVGTSDEPCCVCDFEGIEYELNTRQINALTHAYAISVHKSQGSQFKRVIVPIRDSHFLDQTLIYTAVTRGVDQVVLVGDERAALRAIQAPASATQRHVLLPWMLQCAQN